MTLVLFLVLFVDNIQTFEKKILFQNDIMFTEGGDELCHAAGSYQGGWMA